VANITTANVGALNTSGAVVFNDAGADVDFRVESDTVDHALFVEGSSGNVGIGTSSPSSFAKQTIQFEAGGSVVSAMSLIAYGGSPSIGFRQASGTIASPGASNTSVINLIGASTNDGTNFFNTVAIQGNMESTATSGSHPTLISFATTPSGSTSRAERMRIDSSGGLILVGSTAQKATGTTWSNPSDQRLKDNIRDYTKGTAELMQVRVREWEYNGKGGTIEGTKGLGVVADEVMAVLPDTVENYEAKLNADDEEVTAIKKFDATEITWLLVKTVQELKAELDTVKAELAAIKSQE
jgi:hypothetical protein